MDLARAKDSGVGQPGTGRGQATVVTKVWVGRRRTFLYLATLTASEVY